MNFKGKKTYIIGIAMLCYAVGGTIIGAIEVPEAIQIGLTALGIMGLRNGIKK